MNASLKRVRVIQGDAGELTTSTVTSTATGLIATGAFEDSGRQVQIDLMIQLWQEAQHVVYSLGMYASGVSTATIALVADTNSYALPSDFERMAGNDRDERVWRGVTNGLIVRESRAQCGRRVHHQVGRGDLFGHRVSFRGVT